MEARADRSEFADLGSCSGSGVESALRWYGPPWLEDRDVRPKNPVTVASADSDAESKVVKEVLAATSIDVKTDRFDQLLGRYDFQKTLRICTWIARLVNCRRNVPKFEGPITAVDQESRTYWWIR